MDTSPNVVEFLSYEGVGGIKGIAIHDFSLNTLKYFPGILF